MFALPFSAPPHQSLSSHLFGRLLPRMPPAADEAAGAAHAPAAELEEADDAIPDLAQRVREVGEW